MTGDTGLLHLVTILATNNSVTILNWINVYTTCDSELPLELDPALLTSNHEKPCLL